MPSGDSPISATQIERDVLRVLCGTSVAPNAWHSAVDRLDSYEWRDPEHNVVFEALRDIRTDNAAERRLELPAQATRMGFPDVDWPKYFDPDALPSASIDQLVEKLSSLKD